MTKETKQAIDKAIGTLSLVTSGVLRIKSGHETDVLWAVERLVEEIKSSTNQNFSIRILED